MALLSVIRRWHFREEMPIREIERKRRSGTTWALKLRARSDQAVPATFCVAYAQGSSSSRRL